MRGDAGFAVPLERLEHEDEVRARRTRRSASAARRACRDRLPGVPLPPRARAARHGASGVADPDFLAVDERQHRDGYGARRHGGGESRPAGGRAAGVAALTGADPRSSRTISRPTATVAARNAAATSHSTSGSETERRRRRVHAGLPCWERLAGPRSSTLGPASGVSRRRRGAQHAAERWCSGRSDRRRDRTGVQRPSCPDRAPGARRDRVVTIVTSRHPGPRSEPESDRWVWILSR